VLEIFHRIKSRTSTNNYTLYYICAFYEWTLFPYKITTSINVQLFFVSIFFVAKTHSTNYLLIVSFFILPELFIDITNTSRNMCRLFKDARSFQLSYSYTHKIIIVGIEIKSNFSVFFRLRRVKS